MRHSPKTLGSPVYYIIPVIRTTTRLRDTAGRVLTRTHQRSWSVSNRVPSITLRILVNSFMFSIDPEIGSRFRSCARGHKSQLSTHMRTLTYTSNKRKAQSRATILVWATTHPQDSWSSSSLAFYVKTSSSCTWQSRGTSIRHQKSFNPEKCNIRKSSIRIKSRQTISRDRQTII